MPTSPRAPIANSVQECSLAAAAARVGLPAAHLEHRGPCESVANSALLRVFWRLVRSTTRKKCQFSAKVLACCCCCSRRALSGTFGSANMSIEAHVKRLCRGQYYTECSWRLLRRITFESDECTLKTGHM